MDGQGAKAMEASWMGPIVWIVVLVIAIIYIMYAITKLLISIVFLCVTLAITYLVLKSKFPGLIPALKDNFERFEEVGGRMWNACKGFLPIFRWLVGNVTETVIAVGLSQVDEKENPPRPPSPCPSFIPVDADPQPQN